MGAKSRREGGGPLRAVFGVFGWLWRFLTHKPLPESISLILIILGIDAVLLLVAWNAWQVGREALTVLFFIFQISLTFALFGLDRFMAPILKKRGHRWRVSDRNLLVSCLLGGALGGVLGMALFRHKEGEDIRSLNFRWLVVATVVANLLGLLVAFSMGPETTTPQDGGDGPAAVEERSG